MTLRLCVPVLLAAAFALALLVGSAGGEPGPAPRSAASLGETGGEPPTAAERRGRRRPGCGRFCRQAGGFGAGPDDPNPVAMPKQRVRVARDRIFAVRAKCRLNRKCIGAIIVIDLRRRASGGGQPGNLEYGRANLRIPPHTWRKVLVGMTREGLRFLRRNGRRRPAFATAPLIYGDVAVSVSGRLRLRLPR